MAKYTIREVVEYWAEGIEADSEEEAHKLYLQDQDSYYYGVVSSTTEQEEAEAEEDEAEAEEEEGEDG
jgi:hypothetical protein